MHYALKLFGNFHNGIGAKGEKVDSNRHGVRRKCPVERKYLSMHEIIPPWSLENITIVEVECSQAWSLSIAPHSIIDAPIPKQ